MGGANTNCSITRHKDEYRKVKNFPKSHTNTKQEGLFSLHNMQFFINSTEPWNSLTADSQVQGSGPTHFSLYSLLLLIMVMIPYPFTNSKYEMPVIFIIPCGHRRLKDKGDSSAYIQYLVFTYPCCFSLKKKNKEKQRDFPCPAPSTKWVLL